MPIYEYRCQDCGRVSSFFVRSIGSEGDGGLLPLRQRRHGPADVVLCHGQDHGVGA